MLDSEGPDIIMYQLKSIYNSPFKESYSYPIHTCFPSNDLMIVNQLSYKKGSNFQFKSMVYNVYFSKNWEDEIF